MNQSRPMQLIMNADDFGSSTTVNAAVLRAHRHGVLTSASLMVGGEALGEAVDLAHQTPTLAVGLHLVVVDGPAVLPPAEIPSLVDERGHFPADPVRLGLRYALNVTARNELRHEIRAQFERFVATGLPFSHVDGHWHMHLHPVVLDILLPLAARYGVKGLRLPRDELLLGLSYDRRQAATKFVWAIAFALLGLRSRGRIRAKGLVAAGRVYGLMQSGRMEEAYVLRVLRRVRAPSAELYFHPDTAPGQQDLGPNPGDLATLLSPAVARAIRQRDFDLTTYPELARRELD